MVSVALGTYADKSAVAIGYSRLSGSGRVTLKSHLSADTKKKVGAGVGVGLAW
ncbi:YadA C-terminal domain-containing protein [Moraxella haemolytica]|nr:YadA C-terminal domain-containing protein [Moraxella sp. ZY171148]WII96271.1 YadA C-terminal domain-containing protein [Moraxella sp. ZY171148]